jgi:hypothetical protein
LIDARIRKRKRGSGGSGRPGVRALPLMIRRRIDSYRRPGHVRYWIDSIIKKRKCGSGGSGRPGVRALPLMIRRRIDTCAIGSGIVIGKKSSVIIRMITRPGQFTIPGNVSYLIDTMIRKRLCASGGRGGSVGSAGFGARALSVIRKRICGGGGRGGSVGSAGFGARALPLMIRRRIDTCVTGSGIVFGRRSSVIITIMMTRPRQAITPKDSMNTRQVTRRISGPPPNPRGTMYQFQLKRRAFKLPYRIGADSAEGIVDAARARMATVRLM